MDFSLFRLFLLLFSVILTFQQSNVDQIMVSAGDSGYIIAESNSGLSNRLRVLSAYIFIADALYNHSQVLFVWDINSACPGHFLQVFEPITGVTFISSNEKQLFSKHARKVYHNSMHTLELILEMHGIPKNNIASPFPTWQQIQRSVYSKFYPTKEIMMQVDSYVASYNICNSSAMHIRMTDMNRELEKKRKTLTYKSYFKYVETRVKNMSVYLSTDNPETQQVFLQTYGTPKILVYSVIPQPSVASVKLNSTHSLLPSSPSHSPSSAPFSSELDSFSLQASQHSKNPSIPSSTSSSSTPTSTQSLISSLPEDFRFTSLEHTVIDIFIASHARAFKPAPFSSFSELIFLISVIGWRDRGWCPHVKWWEDGLG